MNRQKLKVDEYYSTSDLALTATLSLFYSIEAIDRQNPYKSRFLFKRDEQLDKLIEAYWRGELKVNPQAYFNQLKVIKSRIYGEEY